jgi:hypothetical protein
MGLARESFVAALPGRELLVRQPRPAPRGAEAAGPQIRAYPTAGGPRSFGEIREPLADELCRDGRRGGVFVPPEDADALAEGSSHSPLRPIGAEPCGTASEHGATAHEQVMREAAEWLRNRQGGVRGPRDPPTRTDLPCPGPSLPFGSCRLTSRSRKRTGSGPGISSR